MTPGMRAITKEIDQEVQALQDIMERNEEANYSGDGPYLTAVSRFLDRIRQLKIERDMLDHLNERKHLYKTINL